MTEIDFSQIVDEIADHNLNTFHYQPTEPIIFHPVFSKLTKYSEEEVLANRIRKTHFELDIETKISEESDDAKKEKMIEIAINQRKLRTLEELKKVPQKDQNSVSQESELDPSSQQSDTNASLNLGDIFTQEQINQFPVVISNILNQLNDQNPAKPVAILLLERIKNAYFPMNDSDNQSHE